MTERMTPVELAVKAHELGHGNAVEGLRYLLAHIQPALVPEHVEEVWRQARVLDDAVLGLMNAICDIFEDRDDEAAHHID